MNFDEAIRAHSEWKMKLSAYLRNPDKSLKADVVTLDNQCALGKWIYGEGSVNSKFPEYTVLKTEHAHFHKAAADVIRKADAGQSVTEETALGGSSVFSKASTAVVSAIMALKKKVTT